MKGNLKEKKNAFRVLWEYKFFIFLVFLIVVFIVLYVDFNKFIVHTKIIELKDTCGIIPNSMYIEHSIKDSEDCNVQCYGMCTSKNYKLKNIDYIENNNACNTCNCICKY